MFKFNDCEVYINYFSIPERLLNEEFINNCLEDDDNEVLEDE